MSEAVQKDIWTWLGRKRVIVDHGVKIGPSMRFIERKGSIAEIRRTLFGNSVRWVGTVGKEAGLWWRAGI